VTLYVDTSALVRRYLRDRHRPLVLEAMGADDAWAASSLVRSEAQVALHRAAVSAGQQQALWRELRDEWEAFWVVPLDERCLARAVELGAAYGVRIVDAVHLAAADRLPRPVRFLTFDRRQIPAADALGFEVVSPVEPERVLSTDRRGRWPAGGSG
jgi:predicted nucleic acid-binding protein